MTRTTRNDQMARWFGALLLLLGVQTANAGSNDEAGFDFALSGRLLLDGNSITTNSQFDDSRPDLQGHGAEIRSARIEIDGRARGWLGYRGQTEFESGHVTIHDAWIGFRGIPHLETLRVGHMKEPYSLTALGELSNLVFMERALPAEAFAPARNLGLVFGDVILEQRMTWRLGAFIDDTGDSTKAFSDGSDVNVTARVTSLPWYADGGSKLFHFGASYSHQFRSRDRLVRLRSRPEAHLVSVRTVDTGLFDARHLDLVTPEIALIYGPVHLQAEYFYVPIKRSGAKDLEYDGFYITLAIFVLEGQRTYDLDEGHFGRVHPANDFRPKEGGWGALELAGRISELDTNGPSLRGGKQLNFTFATNWYLNPNARVSLNYIRGSAADRPDGRNGDLHVVQLRLQLDL